MPTYSFLDCQAAINGPGGSFSLSGGGVAEEGITIEFIDEKGSMDIGADGFGQHKLHAGKAGKVTIRLLKTSPINAKLDALYRFQTSSSANYGQNTITVRDPVRGDDTSCRLCGFAKYPTNTYGKEAGTMEWVFNSIRVEPMLGDGGTAF